MKRILNWEDRLIDYIELNRYRTFSYGLFDCVHLVVGATLAMTGESLSNGRLKPYKGHRGAITALKAQAKKLGMDAPDDFNDLLYAVIDATFTTSGLIKIEKPYISRGDLVFIKESELSLGVCVGQSIAAPGKDGLKFLPTSAAIEGYMIPWVE